MANLLNMTVNLPNSTIPCLLVQPLDEHLRDDIHNTLILSSTILGTLITGFASSFMTYFRYPNLRGSLNKDSANPATDSVTSSVTSVTAV